MKNTRKPVADETIIVMGEVIRKSIMPHIFGLATANMAELEKTVRGVMAAQGFKKPGSVMAMLESDLG